jgi:chromosome segregation ATPase
MSETPMNFSAPPDPPPASRKIPILFGAVLALAAANVYSIYQVKQLQSSIAETRDQLAAEIAQVHETTAVSNQTSKRSVDDLKAELEAANKRAAALAGQAKIEAARHADDLAYQLQQAQAEQERKAAQISENVNAVSAQVSQVQQETTTNRTKVEEVNTNLAAVKTQTEATKAELEKTIAALTRTQGDLGVQSGLIATNARELAALKALGEREYVEFDLRKAKTATRVGDLMVRLTKTDPKKNRYTIEVVVDDKRVEKKDKTINEPVQFLIPRSRFPYELVVNEVRKDQIIGYLSSPKAQVQRAANE